MKTAIITAALALSACAHDPSLAWGVQREGGGIYRAYSIGDAAAQCNIAGRQHGLKIVATTQAPGMGNTTIPKYLFRCE